MGENRTEIRPPAGTPINYELESATGWMRFKIVDRDAAVLFFPGFLFRSLPHWQLEALRVCILDELDRNRLKGEWWKSHDSQDCELRLTRLSGEERTHLLFNGGTDYPL